MSTWSWVVLRSGGIIGWDLGGAHLKVALADRNGRLQRVTQCATPLWQGLEHLQRAIDELAESFPLADCDHYLTMTGELVDLFGSREQGVVELAGLVAARLPKGRVRLYAGPLGFVDVNDARRHHVSIASANWYATAAWLAGMQSQGLLVDIGSTTTDLLPFSDGDVRNRGYSDRERLASEEMVYTGVVRTPVMAMAQRVPFAGEWHHVTNEHFATSADVYRILGSLPGHADLHPSADGRDKGIASSMQRLARMLGADLSDGSDQDWRALAAFLSDRQLDVLSLACRCQFSLGLPPDAPLVGAGVGKFLVQRLARRLDREFVDIDDLFEEPVTADTAPAVCAPAVAVAQLAATEGLACAC